MTYTESAAFGHSNCCRVSLTGPGGGAIIQRYSYGKRRAKLRTLRDNAVNYGLRDFRVGGRRMPGRHNRPVCYVKHADTASVVVAD